MRQRFLKDGCRFIHFSVSLLVFSAACRSGAQGYFAGTRGGISFDGGTKRFHEAEAFGGMNFPLRWDIYAKWYLKPGADISAGWISDGDTSGFVGTAGPIVTLGKGKFPVTLEGGSSPTYLSRYIFATKDFGDNVQFTSHIGLDWALTKYFTAGWRFQHMSNAHLARPNPGVNMQMFSLRFNF